jgi:uncharacterized protein
VEIEVRLQPRASRDEIAGERAGRLLVRVTAPPVEGRANKALCELLAKRLRIARSAVTVIRGERSRDKLVRIDGADPQVVRRAFGLTPRKG